MKQPTAHIDSLTFKISIVLAVVTLLTLLLQLAEPIRSHDIWWHIIIGKNILDTGSLIVDHSIFSWTPAISYVVYNSWLSEIILYLIDYYLGTNGLIALRYFVFIGIVALAWHFSIKRGIAKHPLTWSITLLSLSFMWGAALIKPELFTLGFMPIVVWLYYYMRFKGNSGWYLPYFYPVIFLLWANLHGAYFISALFFISAVVGEFLNVKFSPDQAMPETLRKHFLIALGLSFLAIFINPYGYELPLETIRAILFSGVVAQKSVIAFQPTFLLNAAPLFLLDYLIASMLLFVFLIWQKLKKRQTDWVAILAYVIFTILFVQIGRVTLFLGPVFLFTALDLLAFKNQSWAWPSFKTGRLLLQLVSIAIVFTISGRAVYVQRCQLHHPISLIQNMFDRSADTLEESANYIEQNLSGKRIGNEYDTGGYLIYRFWPEKKTMIDSRTFPFPAWIDDYFQIEAGSSIEQFLQKYDADFWILSYERTKLIKWLSSSEQWKLAFIGPNGGVFVPTSDLNKDTVVSDKIDALDNLPAISKVLIQAFHLNDSSLVRRLYNAGITNLDQNCGNVKTYLEELENTTIGMELFDAGHFQIAANRLAIPGRYFDSRNRAADALVKLAIQKRIDGEIAQSRSAYLDIFTLFPQALLTDAYNFAILDWQYRHSENGGLTVPTDGLNWQDLTTVFLQKKESLEPGQHNLLEVIEALNTGIYDGSAKMVPRNYGLRK